eukprot:350381-Prymnesium_polylepis.1
MNDVSWMRPTVTLRFLESRLTTATCAALALVVASATAPPSATGGVRSDSQGSMPRGSVSRG